jgi:hypothetical protein
MTTDKRAPIGAGIFGDWTTMDCSQNHHGVALGSSLGRPKTVSDDYLDRLKELASQTPRHFGYPFERWTAQYLQRRLAQEFDLQVSDRHIHRLLKQMGLSTRPGGAGLPDRAIPNRAPKIAIHDLDVSASS